MKVADHILDTLTKWLVELPENEICSQDLSETHGEAINNTAQDTGHKY
jgi:hypothetical protein